jgi:hypothetical protein
VEVAAAAPPRDDGDPDFCPEGAAGG